MVIANPDISSMNGGFTLIIFQCLGIKAMRSFGNMGRDLFRNLKQHSCEFITPSN